jgi:plastocyanin
MNTLDDKRFEGWPAATETRRGLLRHTVLGMTSLGLVGLTAACGGNDGADGPNRGGALVTNVSEVAVRDNYFEPAAIEVPLGTTVTWRWEGDHDHNVVGDDFASDVQTEGDFARSFTEPGRHAYRCTLHGGMDGEVVVAESGA